MLETANPAVNHDGVSVVGYRVVRVTEDTRAWSQFLGGGVPARRAEAHVYRQSSQARYRAWFKRGEWLTLAPSNSSSTGTKRQ